MRTILSLLLSVGLILVIASPPQAGDNPRAELLALLDKSIKACGGEAKVAKLRALSWKGTSPKALNGELTLNHEGSFHGWDLFRMDTVIETNGGNRTFLLVLTNGKGWIMPPGGKANDLPPKVAAPAIDYFYTLRVAQMLPALKGQEFELSHLGELKVEERAALGIRVSRKGRPDVSLFLDKESFLPLKTASRFPDQQGQEKDLEVLFSDYKDFDGLKHFTTFTFRREDSKDVRTELSEVRPEGELDPDRFAKP